MLGLPSMLGLPLCGAMCLRGTRTRARRTICGALLAFRVANSAKHNSASVFMRASFVDFSVELISLPDELATALAPQLYWTHDISSQAWLRIDCT